MRFDVDEDFLLVQRMRRGDERAFESFVTKYYPAILKYCQIQIRDYGYAEDMTQEMSDNQLKKYLGVDHKILYSQKKLQETVQKSKMAFAKGEAQTLISYAEFLYQQGRYIHKRWWALQAATLFLLWVILHLTESAGSVQMGMGVAAALFFCAVFCFLWIKIVLNERVYGAVSRYPIPCPQVSMACWA